MKILSGELDSTSGEVSILPNIRMSVLKQDQNAYDAYSVMDTVIMGSPRLYEVGNQKDALDSKTSYDEYLDRLHREAHYVWAERHPFL